MKILVQKYRSNSNDANQSNIGRRLLYGSIFLSLCFFVLTMVKGFGLHNDHFFQTDHELFSWARAGSEWGLWHCYIAVSYEWTSEKILSYLSPTGICCVIFFIVSSGLLVSGLILCRKSKIKLNKFLLGAVISTFTIFALTLLMALVGRPSGELHNTFAEQETRHTISIFFILNVVGGFLDHNYTFIIFTYTATAIATIVLLSLLSIPAIIFTGIFLFNEIRNPSIRKIKIPFSS